MKRFLIIVTALLCACFCYAQQRETLDLSNSGWSITLDPEAPFQNDTLYFPTADLNEIPVNLPTGGWDLLMEPQVRGVQLPATVEQYLWGANGDSFGNNGNYVGVSWFETSFDVPAEWAGRHVNLYFESVRLRAEVFVNHKLAGYDVIYGTPLTFDVSDYLDYGKHNVLSVRITDPCGNLDWRDGSYSWGMWDNFGSGHGFGGIGNHVSLTATDKLYVSDLFVMNTADPHKVSIEVTAENLKGVSQAPIQLTITDKATGKQVYSKKWTATLTEGTNTIKKDLKLPSAKLWDVENPNLYIASVKLGEDCIEKRFGFRSFTIGEENGNRQFYLNGKRIVLRSAISWGFWPENGLYPTDEMARKQIETAKSFGQNMLNFHRCIGTPCILDYADELGLLYYEEPGSNEYIMRVGNKSFPEYRNERMYRMVRRDRSHPSLIIYNMMNENDNELQPVDYEEMAAVHKLDPSRTITFTSPCCHEVPELLPSKGDKLRLEPFNDNFLDTGWWDSHNAGSRGCYSDYFYKSPTDYRRYSGNKSEIVFWGEEGALGTPPRLELIKNDLEKRGVTNGWDVADHKVWYEAFDKFLTEKGFREDFPTVDDLTRQMGNISLYQQGRQIEAIRMGNVADGYCVNGWESMKTENHSGIVDIYRNPKGDPEVLAYYNRPLYLAVKAKNMVLPLGKTSRIDVFIINEKNLHGPYDLTVSLVGPDGQVLSKETRPVNVSGGSVYGELLSENFEVSPKATGYSEVKAELSRKGVIACDGHEKIFTMELDTTGLEDITVSVADTSGFVKNFLDAAGIKNVECSRNLRDYPAGDCLIVCDFPYGASKSNSWFHPYIRFASEGGTVIFIGNPEESAEFLNDKEVADFRGRARMRDVWFGGNFFSKTSPIMEGLPQGKVWNWEFSSLIEYRLRRPAMRFENGETIVGVSVDHKHELFSALTRFTVGNGQIYHTTLNIPFCLSGIIEVRDMSAYAGELDVEKYIQSDEAKYDKMVGQQILLNMIKSAR